MVVGWIPVTHDGNGGLRSCGNRHRVCVKKGVKSVRQRIECATAGYRCTLLAFYRISQSPGRDPTAGSRGGDTAAGKPYTVVDSD